ncbi:MAG TPA: alpha/beta hydrolase [Polyangiaceae bacterium]|nr:alpha/beta hydrolase [Polyangiaceae bacterium]
MAENKTESLSFVPHTMRVRDAVELRAFTLGPAEGPTVALINAYGMPIEFMRPLAQELAARDLRVVTWESRGVPNMEPGFIPESCGPLTHAHDLFDVMDYFGVKSATVVGWCSGAQVALRFAGLFPERTCKLVLINGVYALWEKGVFSEFQTKMNHLLPMCAKSPQSAALICNMISAQLSGCAGSSEDENQVGSVVGAVPPEILPLTAGVFSSGERLYRYAHLEARFLEEPDGAWTQGVQAETLVMVGDSDDMSSPENSAEVVRRLPHARLKVVKNGNHYIHYTRPDAYLEIAEFAKKGVSHDVQRAQSAAHA